MNILLSLDLWHFMLREMNVLFSAVEKMILLGCGFICEACLVINSIYFNE